MKTPLAILFLAIVMASPRIASAAEPAGGGLLQKGLYEEEANHDLNAAIEAYQAFVAQFDAQRQATATAIFRLGECYRKQGKTNEAAAFYQRILRDFADQTELARLSRTFAPPQVAAKGSGSESETDKQKRAEVQHRANQSRERIASYEREIAGLSSEFLSAKKELTDQETLLQHVRSSSPATLPVQISDVIYTVAKDLYERAVSQVGSDEDSKKQSAARAQTYLDQMQQWVDFVYVPRQQSTIRLTERRLQTLAKTLEFKRVEKEDAELGLERELAKLSSFSASAEVSVESQNLSPGTQQRKQLIEEEIRLVEQQLRNAQGASKQGVGDVDSVIKLQREILALKREMLALEKPRVDLLDVPVPTKANAAATAAPANGDPVPESAAPATDDETKELQRIKTIIKDSPDLVNAPRQGWQPLHTAAINGQLAVAEFLLANKAEVNGVSSRGGATPLHLAVESGHKTMAELLIAHGAEVNARGVAPTLSYQGLLTPLHVAIAKGHKVVTQILLENKADINAKTVVPDNQTANEYNIGLTPLDFAMAYGRKELAELLLSNGADINSRSDNGSTPLSVAAKFSQETMVNWLLEHKADVNVADNRGWTSLHWAAGNSKEIVAMLLKAGANPNAQSKVTELTRSGWTPLHNAVSQHKKEIVELLLANGADSKLKSLVGQIPLNLAQDYLARNRERTTQSGAAEEIIRLLSKPAQ